MKKLPIGISTFAKIRDENYCYADKTGFISQLLEHGSYFFLSRPRRFGKSLFVDTLKEAFACNRRLFTGLAIEQQWNWDKPSPIINVSLGGGVVKSRAELDQNLAERLAEFERNAGATPAAATINGRFRELILVLAERSKEKVVILIDEYDKPILDNITNPGVARDIREGLKNFYAVIKDCDAYVRFCFLTGVSKFAKVSLFSGLNNLEDLTLNPAVATLCGYTQHDLETIFSEHLEGLDPDQVKAWYNGYNFLGEPVYNPFDVLLLLKNRTFRNYWFETGTPTFLIDMLYQRRFSAPDLEKVIAGDSLLGSFDVDRIEPENLMFQTGYLTIKKQLQMGGAIMYELSYPNLEVKMSLTDRILDSLSSAPGEKDRGKQALFEALSQANLDRLRDVFHAFFASIPHDWYRKNELSGYEGYYASIFYCYFTALGLDVKAEDATSKGRIDLSVRLDNRIFLFEFKVAELCPPGNALAQLEEKRYHEKYAQPGVDIFLVGIEFSKTDRNILAFEWKRRQPPKKRRTTPTARGQRSGLRKS